MCLLAVASYSAAQIVFVPAVHTAVARAPSVFETVSQFVDLMYLASVISTSQTGHSTSTDCDGTVMGGRVFYCVVVLTHQPNPTDLAHSELPAVTPDYRLHLQGAMHSACTVSLLWVHDGARNAL